MADNYTRKEMKYMVSGAVLEVLQRELEPYLKKDKFFFERIHNIYYDNDFDDLICTSIQKPVFKEKMRLRGYEFEGEMFPYVYAEAKRKFKGIVYKRRTRFPMSELETFLSGKKSPAEVLGDSQVAQEICFLIDKTRCYPKLYLSYDRYSYRAKNEEEDLRLTVDSNIVSRTELLNLSVNPKLDVPLIGSDDYLMEIKTGFAFPLWLTEILTRYKIFPVSFSKYGRIYEKSLRDTPLKESCYV